jgi:hypothetical protein
MSQTDKAVTIEMRAAGNTGRKGYCRDLKARMWACQSNEALLLAPSATIVPQARRCCGACRITHAQALRST